MRVFDSTLCEVGQILQKSADAYEDPISVQQFRILQTLHRRKVSKGELRQRTALVETDLSALGVDTVERPPVTCSLPIREDGLRRAQEDPGEAGTSSRVEYDVRSIEGVLSLRGNSEPKLLSKCRAVLAVTSGEVVTNVHSWWRNEEHCLCLPPVLGLRELANYAWLIKPAGSADMPLVSMLATCSAALRPSERYWRDFVGHVVRHEGLSEQQKVAIIESDAAEAVLRRHEDQLLSGEREAIDYERAVEEARRVVVDQPVETALSDQREELEARYETEREEAICQEREASARAVAAKIKPIVWAAWLFALLAGTVLLYNMLLHVVLPLLVGAGGLGSADTVLGVLGLLADFAIAASGSGKECVVNVTQRLASWLVAR